VNEHFFVVFLRYYCTGPAALREIIIVQKYLPVGSAGIIVNAFFLLFFLAQPASAQLTQATPLTDSTVQLPSGKIFYRDSGGTGVPVIFLHAGSGNSMMWEYQIPVFIEAGYRFIAIDYRGVDTAPTAPAGIDASTRISELVALLGLEQFHLVGTAAGGGTALQYALAHREQLRSITIANSIGNVQDSEYTEMGRRIRPPQFNQLPLEMRELGPSYRAANPDGVARWLALAGEDRIAANIAVTPAATTSPTATADSPNAVTWARLETLMVPTLFITGAADLYTPPSVLRLFTDHMKHAESHVIVESGHSAFWENPELFNSLVLEFIDRH
jgi:pimeloyl-ACP methyl ester carboxylesterase